MAQIPSLLYSGYQIDTFDVADGKFIINGEPIGTVA